MDLIGGDIVEDSRNIVKAIDALTEKTGGIKVDSYNIIDAIDNLREAFNNSAMTRADVEEIIEEYLIENPVSPSTIASAVTEYLENNPIDVSSLTLGSLNDGNGNVTLHVITD